jgi:hypothetical protein
MANSDRSDCPPSAELPGASVNGVTAAMGKQPNAVAETLRRVRRTLLGCIERPLTLDAAT